VEALWHLRDTEPAAIDDDHVDATARLLDTGGAPLRRPAGHRGIARARSAIALAAWRHSPSRLETATT